MTVMAKHPLGKFLDFVATAPTDLHQCEAILNDIFHTDICWELPAGSGPSMGGKNQGIKKTAQLLVNVFTNIYSPKGFQCIVHELFGEGERAVARYRINATTIGGHPYSNEYAIVAHSQDGKLTHIWEYLDTFMAAKQIYPMSS